MARNWKRLNSLKQTVEDVSFFIKDSHSHKIENSALESSVGNAQNIRNGSALLVQ
jgi:hypothetical protein